MPKYILMPALVFSYAFLRIASIGSLSTCFVTINCHKLDTADFYKVYKIDSIKNFYIIYVVNNGLRFKVVSKKASAPCNQPITVGKAYPLKLTYVLGMAAGGVFKPTCVNVASNTRVCLEDSIRDVCYADNLRGLCFKP
jgi:hypothetical protein